MELAMNIATHSYWALHWLHIRLFGQDVPGLLIEKRKDEVAAANFFVFSRNRNSNLKSDLRQLIFVVLRKRYEAEWLE